MIDFEVTGDHKIAADLARDVAGKYLKPQIAELDRQQKYDPAFVKRLKDADLLGICFPENMVAWGWITSRSDWSAKKWNTLTPPPV